ncbi:hypothetical protein [uncultured Campylobacter sp.]|uniref:hypothetical protein n=1 Tax=uncultured Campylobacter sp. TaxID=218934 RepID=UPI0026372B87|nr:hypothetical protein [uncultured Campylobacter sp.]
MLKLAVFILNFMVKFVAKFGLNLATKQGFKILKFKAKGIRFDPFAVKFKQAF